MGLTGLLGFVYIYIEGLEMGFTGYVYTYIYRVCSNQAMLFRLAYGGCAWLHFKEPPDKL